MFNLVKACKDCPFKKGMSYLSEEGVLERINDVRYGDKSFTCHKTIDYDALSELNEVHAQIDDEVEILSISGCSRTELIEKKLELVEEYGLANAIEAYEKSKKDEMYCAGMLILAKKAGFLMNNRALRYAVAQDLLDLNQFVDENEVFDSVEEALESHRDG